jgi:hypothetical protein
MPGGETGVDTKCPVLSAIVRRRLSRLVMVFKIVTTRLPVARHARELDKRRIGRASLAAARNGTDCCCTN